jgi:predicted enzyme related to lactoylglutathione lyase
MFTKETAKVVSELVKKGTFGHGGFECNDIYATYEELSAKGVAFAKPPKEEFYGVAAVFSDDSGNWFSLTQKN